MIEDKLEKARLHSARRRMQIGIGLALTLFLCGLLLFGLSFYHFSTPDAIPVAVSEQEGLPDSDRDTIRGEFKELLQRYEGELEPRLLAANVELWNRDVFFAMAEQKQEAMVRFSSGEYLEARDSLQILTSGAEAVLEEAEQIFRMNLEQATSLLGEDLYDGAKLHIEKALMLRPQSPEALEVQQQIEKLPDLLPLVQGARVARAENDLQKEYDYLRQVLKIAPDREGVNARLAVLAERIRTEKFNKHISSGFAGIEKRQIKQARYHYQEAKKLDPKRAELPVLLQQVLALEKSLRLQRAIQQAEQAVRRDDWQQAKIHFSSAAKDAPENKTVAEGLRRADTVLGLLSRFSHYFQDPYRLAHGGVRKEAEQTLGQAETASGYSFAILRQAKQLRELIDKVNRPVPVTVISDNKTFVSVRRVGRVGTVSEKTIQLKPGRYTFEGARTGFTSKLVEAFIPYDQSDFRVRVICDEPI